MGMCVQLFDQWLQQAHRPLVARDRSERRASTFACSKCECKGGARLASPTLIGQLYCSLVAKDLQVVTLCTGRHILHLLVWNCRLLGAQVHRDQFSARLRRKWMRRCV